MKKHLSIIFLLLLALTFVVSGCGTKQESAKQPEAPKAATPEPAKAEKLKVAFIYVGPVGDAGWSFTHDEGRKYLEKQLGDKVETTFVESVPEGADAERVLTELCEKGNKVIFATSFGYMDPVIKVAQKYPNVVFMHCSGYKTAKNVGTYFGRMYQARYLSGIIAGKMTKKNEIGYVAAFPIPEVVRMMNAFTLGVQSVNPKAKVKVVWTNTWYDPAKEKDAAVSLIQGGADFIAQHQDTPGPQQAAEEAGIYSIGYNCDMSKFAPKANLTSPVWNWGPYYVKTVQSVIDKTWVSGQYWGPMSDGIVGLAPISDKVPADVKKLVEDKKQEIESGKLVLFTGPIKDNTGKERVAAGQTMTDDKLLSFDWLVEGIDGNIPK